MRGTLLFAAGAAGCTTTYTNKASTPITLCKRVDFGTPGETGSKTLLPGESWAVECPVSNPGQSNWMLFSTRDWDKCGRDEGCDKNSGTCLHYPWEFGTGVSYDHPDQWYGFIATNFDFDTGFTGDYGGANVHYGIEFRCSSYNGAQHHAPNCSVVEGSATCTPNVPHGTRPASGVMECDSTQLELDIFDSPCKSTEYCCPEAKKCLTPVVPVTNCEHNASVCLSDAVCCPVTKICVNAGAPCTAPISAGPPAAPTCGMDEYCCPDAKHCLKPAENPICAGANDCKAGEVCCPVTNECVSVGAACTSNCSDTASYCCPDAKHCLTPLKPEQPCDPAAAGACGAGATCCPLTKLCVKVGANCTPEAECSSSEYCCPEAKHCLTPTFTPSVTKCASNADCGSGGTCCPLTQICVAVGAACDPMYPL